MTYRKLFGGVVALLLAATFAQPVAAQRAGYWMWNAQYSTALPMGTTKDYTDGFSWRGATFDIERAANDNVAFGLSLGWHVMDDKVVGTEEFDQGAVSGTAYRYVNSVPVLLTGTYFAGDRRSPRPFLSAGAGTYYVKNRTEVGVFAIENSNWHLGLMAEAGVMIPRPGGTGMTLSARYNWGLETSDIERQYFTFSIGYTVGN
jgi:hypothetical protein